MRGNITNTGYLDDSPDRFNDYNVIPSRRITMQGVSQPLMLFPIKNGKVANPVQAMPGQDYYFPDSQGVVEIPLPQGSMQYERYRNGGPTDAQLRSLLSNVVMKKGGGTITPELAAKMLKNGMIYGKPITASQKDKLKSLAAQIGIDENGDPIEEKKDRSEDVEEYKRGGSPKAKKKHSRYTSKNIFTSINEIFARNTDLYGEGGKQFYKPELRMGGWLDKYQTGREFRDNDSYLENYIEIFDPTGTTSWDDVERAYKNTGLSGETIWEIAGAIPLLGKIAKLSKPAIHLAKYKGLDQLLFRYLPKSKILSKTSNIIDKGTRATNAADATSTENRNLLPSWLQNMWDSAGDFLGRPNNSWDNLGPMKKGGWLDEMPKAQIGLAQTPEAWEKEIRNVEHQIGPPNQWTMDGYNLLQKKLNEYKNWRENTPEGRAVIDYHNEPNEYVVPLPPHLTKMPKAQAGVNNMLTMSQDLAKEKDRIANPEKYPPTLGEMLANNWKNYDDYKKAMEAKRTSQQAGFKNLHHKDDKGNVIYDLPEVTISAKKPTKADKEQKEYWNKRKEAEEKYIREGPSFWNDPMGKINTWLATPGAFLLKGMDYDQLLQEGRRRAIQDKDWQNKNFLQRVGQTLSQDVAPNVLNIPTNALIGAMAAEALPALAAYEIPGAVAAGLPSGVATVGNIANAGFIGTGLSKLPATAGSWVDVAKGKKDWRDAAGQTAENTLYFLGANEFKPGMNLLSQDLKAAKNYLDPRLPELNIALGEEVALSSPTIEKARSLGFIPEGVTTQTLKENPVYLNKLIKQGINKNISVSRGVSADALLEGRAVDTGGRFKELAQKDAEALKKFMQNNPQFTEEEAIAFYAGTHLPFKQYGSRTGLKNLLPSDMDALYHVNLKQGYQGSPIDFGYGPYMVKSRYPFDFSGSSAEWLDRYRKMPFISEKNLGRRLTQGDIKSGAIWSSPSEGIFAESAIIGKPGEKVLNPVSLRYPENYAAKSKIISEDLNKNINLYQGAKAGNEESIKAILEKASALEGKNITNVDEAHNILSKNIDLISRALQKEGKLNYKTITSRTSPSYTEGLEQSLRANPQLVEQFGIGNPLTLRRLFNNKSMNLAKEPSLNYAINSAPAPSMERMIADYELGKANKDALAFSQSAANRAKLEAFRPGQNFNVTNQEARFTTDPEAQRLFEKYASDPEGLGDKNITIDEYMGGSSGKYGARNYGDLEDVVIVRPDKPMVKDVPTETAYEDAIHEMTHSRSLRLGATDAEKELASDAWAPMIKKQGWQDWDLAPEEAFAVQNELRLGKLNDIKGERVYTEADIPEIKKGLQQMINNKHPYLRGVNVEDFDMPALIKSLNKVGIGSVLLGTGAGAALMQQKKGGQIGWLDEYE